MQVFALSLRKLLIATAASVILALASTPLHAQDDPPAQAGRLSYISGDVSIQPAGSDDWGEALPNLPFGPGDRIFTDSDGRAEVQVGQTFIRIGPNSDVSFVDGTPFSISIGVAQGSVHVHCLGLWPGQRLHVNTPSGSGGLDQPGELRVDVMPDEGAAIFTNLGWQSFVGGPGFDAETLRAGQALELAGSNPVVPQWLQPADWDDLDRWSQQRDRQIANAASYRYVSPEIPGAYELDASGDWQPGTQYGAVWFPRNVPADWAPYHYGHWVNHAPWGWVWVEDEPWGYAPFHYGRWVSFNGRWGWIPGPVAAHPVWSPALVVFAGGIHVGGASVSAWFPLGPGEAYRPWYPCSPRYVDQVNISNISESPRVHVQTTYVNINVVNVTYVNRTIGVSAVSNADFAAGRPVGQARVVVDVHVFDHVQVLERPEPQPSRASFVGHPPARPVRVSVARPVVINESGKLVSSRPGSQPMAPPVRPAPPMRALPGRTAVAPPPGSKAPAAPGAPMARPVPAAPMARPTPAAAPAFRPDERPTERPAPQPAGRPAAQPVEKFAPPPQAARPAAPPAERPAPPMPPKPAVQPPAKPGAPPADKSHDNKKNDKEKKEEK
ncbi:MAG: DUF6600 domain-containing protein [Terracidiphilus sp.]|jgi:hypothetical protein